MLTMDVWIVARDGRLIGTCSLHGFDPAVRTAEVGCLLNPSIWGKGYDGQLDF